MKRTKIWLVSDTHFSHPNILKYVPKRVIQTAEYIIKKQYGTINGYEKEIQDAIDNYNEACKNQDFDAKIEFLKWHDEMIIDKWNSKIQPDDTVYFLGDFAFCHKTKFKDLSDREFVRMLEIGQQLNGHKTILLGNHDWRKHSSYGEIVYNPTLDHFFHQCGFERVEFNPFILSYKGKKYLLSHEPQCEIINKDGQKISIKINTGDYINKYGHIHDEGIGDKNCVCLDANDMCPCELK